jgi:hypothetical protein
LGPGETGAKKNRSGGHIQAGDEKGGEAVKSYIRYCGDESHKSFSGGVCSACGLPNLIKAKEMAMDCYILDESGADAGFMAGFAAGEANMFNRATAYMQQPIPEIFSASQALAAWRRKQNEISPAPKFTPSTKED